MAKKRHTPEQVVNLLRQVEVGIANGKATVLACKEASITEQTYYRGVGSMVGFRWTRRSG